VQGNDKDGTLAIEGDSSSSEPFLEWKDGLMITAGEKKLFVREFMICEYGSARTVKFITLD
jgi:hypothetical protein